MLTSDIVASIVCMLASLHGDKHVSKCEKTVIEKCTNVNVAKCFEEIKKTNFELIKEIKKAKK